MYFSTLASLSLLGASVAASTPVLTARAATTTVYMRIEGPTKTLYEKTMYPTIKNTLTNNGHTKTCNGTPDTAAGVTSLVALQETGQYFEAQWNGTDFGAVTKLNGTSNSEKPHGQWASVFNNAANTGANGGGLILQGSDDDIGEDAYDQFCYQTIPDGQHFLFAYLDDFEASIFLIMSGPKTATVGSTVQYSIPYTLNGTYVNDLSVDTTTGQTVYGEYIGEQIPTSSISITFTKAGTYNMKAHCPSGSECIRSNHVVTVVS
ncbi:hypothetical protein FIBSPDRAFT_869099 [Athelia psychrophila]|uniref:Uncharacterized protein n=1 Tax=Athelia psychrophila TaxID=1759441 RepID=A0A166CEW3_9AGAM|nr:hypothetical protein FIBSPDRAFT_869099 [Fibularhizoctonia sp. CBS 109695]